MGFDSGLTIHTVVWLLNNIEFVESFGQFIQNCSDDDMALLLSSEPFGREPFS